MPSLGVLNYSLGLCVSNSGLVVNLGAFAWCFMLLQNLAFLFLCFRYEIRDVHLVEESVLEALKIKADFQSFKPRPFNMLEFYNRTGHDIRDMLLSCHFRGKACRPEDFKVVSASPFLSTSSIFSVFHPQGVYSGASGGE